MADQIEESLPSITFFETTSFCEIKGKLTKIRPHCTISHLSISPDEILSTSNGNWMSNGSPLPGSVKFWFIPG